MVSISNTNAEVIAAFRANGGAVAAPYDNPPPMVLLHTIGARTGREHIVPMRALVESETLYVFASAHGSARHPDWYRNVIANPDFDIEIGTDTIAVHATEITGSEREAVLARWIERVPVVAGVIERTPREIPVIRLTPRQRA